MAQLALAAVGGLIGSTWGTVGAQAGFLFGGLAGGLLFGQRQKIPGPRNSELQVQASTYGHPIYKVYAKMRVAGEVIWASDIEEHKKEIDTGSSTDSFGGGAGQILYSYTANFAVAVCEGPMAAVLRIWADTKLIYDTTPGAKRKHKYKPSVITIYLGTEDQMPDPLMEARMGVGNVPAYRGLCYIVFDDLPLKDFGNRIPNIRVEVVENAENTDDTLPLTTDFNFAPSVLDEFDHGALHRETLLIDPRPGYPYAYVFENDSGYSGDVGMSIFKINLTTGQIEQSSASGYYGGSYGSADMDAQGHIYWAGPYVPKPPPPPPPCTPWQPDTGTLTARWTTVGMFNADSLGLMGVGQIFYPNPPAELGLPPECTHFCDFMNVYKPSGFFRAERYTEKPKVWHVSSTDTLHSHVTSYIPIPERDPDCQLPLMFQADNRSATTFGLIGGTFAGPVRIRDLDIDANGTPWFLIAGSGITRLNHIDGRNLDAEIPNAKDIMWVPQDNSLIIGNQSKLIKYDIETEEVIASLNFLYTDNRMSFHNGVHENSIWLADVATEPGIAWPRFTQINVLTLTIVETQIFKNVETQYPVPGGSEAFDPVQVAYSPETGSFVAVDYGRRAVGIFGGRKIADCVSLQSVVEDLSRKAGLQVPEEVDASDLADDEVCGFVLDQRQPIRSFLESLMSTHFFDGVESDGKIKFFKRGRSSVMTIPESDLATHAYEEERPPFSLVETRQQEIELPERVDILYFDPDLDYQQGNQHAKRILRNIHTEEKSTLNVPEVFTADEAKAIAERNLYLSWMERDSKEVTLPYKYIGLDPADVITVAMDGGATFKLRVVQADLGANLVYRLKLVAEDAVVYQAVTKGSRVIIDPPDSITVPGPSSLVLLDIPMFRDADNNAGLYVAASPFTAAESSWSGTAVYRSADQIVWAAVGLLDTLAPMGQALSVLPATDRWTVWDETNTVTVKLFAGELNNATAAQVLNGANYAVLGNEVIQFRTATPVGAASANTWELSGLLRGRKGTEWAVESHAVNEQFVMLNPAWIRRLNGNLDEIGLLRYYRGPSLGTTFEEATTIPFTNTAAALRPYSPGHITGARDMDDNLTISWIRRTRIGGEWKDYLEVPLGETSEQYSIDIYDGADVVRTLGSTTEAVEYTADDQTEDFGSPQAAVTVVVYQLSDSVGRGTGREATV